MSKNNKTAAFFPKKRKFFATKLLAIHHQTGLAQVLNAATYELVSDAFQLPPEIAVAALAPDGDGGLFASRISVVYRCSIPQSGSIVPLNRIPHGIQELDFSSSGRFFLTSGNDGTVRYWDTATGIAIGPLHNLAVGVGERLPWEAGSPEGPGLRKVFAQFGPDDKAVFAHNFESRSKKDWIGSLDPSELSPPVVLPAPRTVEGSPDRIKTWIEVLTGMELNAEGIATLLDEDSWRGRKRRLESLGGPPP